MMNLRLTPLYDTNWGEILIDKYPFSLGRHPECHEQILHPLISRLHCRIYLNGEGHWLEDLDSRNGTTVNGEAVKEPQLLQEGDVIGLPFYAFRVEVVPKSTLVSCSPCSSTM